MILKKIIVNDKEVFEPISFEDALKYKNKTALIFTNEDEEQEFLDKLEEISSIEDIIEESYDQSYEEFNKKRKNVFNFNELGDMFNNLFTKVKRNTKSGKLVAALPYLDEEDIHEVVEGILANSEEYKDLNLVQVIPFLSKEDADRIFMRFVIENDQDNYKNIYGVVPFVSTECLSKFVDEYIKGNYQNINMDVLYPHMSSQDVKRVFKYIMSKKDF